VKKILVAQRENPIVNRLNKTKVEKFPDLAMEREEKLKALRKKDQFAKLERVSKRRMFDLGLGRGFSANISAEERRSSNRSGAEGKEMAERPRL
jgi:hypothetical protein